MSYAISLWFDDESEKKIRNIWKALSESNLSSVLWTGSYRPHITLAVCEELNLPLFKESLSELFKATESFQLTLPLIGCFTSLPGNLSSSGSAVFLGVTPTNFLLNFHAEIHKQIGFFGKTPKKYYLPNIWNPHCTLAPGVLSENIPNVIKVVQKTDLPLVIKVTRIGVIDTPAEIELDYIKLQ